SSSSSYSSYSSENSSSYSSLSHDSSTSSQYCESWSNSSPPTTCSFPSFASSCSQHQSTKSDTDAWSFRISFPPIAYSSKMAPADHTSHALPCLDTSKSYGDSASLSSLLP